MFLFPVFLFHKIRSLCSLWVSHHTNNTLGVFWFVRVSSLVLSLIPPSHQVSQLTHCVAQRYLIDTKGKKEALYAHQ